MSSFQDFGFFFHNNPETENPKEFRTGSVCSLSILYFSAECAELLLTSASGPSGRVIVFEKSQNLEKTT